MEFKKYRRLNIAEMHKYDPNNKYPDGFMDRVSISLADKDAGSPKMGDMIARNPDDYNDMWLVAEDYFKKNFEAV